MRIVSRFKFKCKMTTNAYVADHPPRSLSSNPPTLTWRYGRSLFSQARDARQVFALKETFFSNDEVLCKAFEREAQFLANLDHPALPKVTDHFAEGGSQFLIMEYVPGDDLATQLKTRGQPFNTREVLEWADQLLDALEYLHAHDPPIIHRDIKPENLKLNPRGKIILLDFGLAKGATAEMSHMSRSIFGFTPNYAPLEQVQGERTDARSDLYSLGATLYHLLTAQIPPRITARLAAVADGHVDPLRPADEINSQVPSSVAAVLTRAKARDRSRRPHSAADMRHALSNAGQLLRPVDNRDLPPTVVDGVQERDAQFPSPTPSSRPIRRVQPQSDTIGAEYQERIRKQRLVYEAEARRKQKEDEDRHRQQVEQAARKRAEKIAASSRVLARNRRTAATSQHAVFTTVLFLLSTFLVAMVKPPLWQSFGLAGRVLLVVLFAIGVWHLIRGFRAYFYRYSYTFKSISILVGGYVGTLAIALFIGWYAQDFFSDLTLLFRIHASAANTSYYSPAALIMLDLIFYPPIVFALLDPIRALCSYIRG